MANNIAQLLKNAFAVDPIASSEKTEIYQFGKEDIEAHPELRQYVIRKKRAGGEEALRNGTALTPVNPLVCGLNVGQPFMQLDGSDAIQILRRQEGESCDQLEARLYKELVPANHVTSTRNALETAYQAQLAHYELLLDFAKDGKNPYTQLFNDSYRLGMLGFQCDTNPNNILIDSTHRCLKLVDQCTAPLSDFQPHALGKINIERFYAGLLSTLEFPLAPVDTTLAAQHIEARRQLSELLEKAYRSVSRRRISDKDHKIELINTDSVQAVALTKPPQALVDQLRVLEKLSAIAR